MAQVTLNRTLDMSELLLGVEVMNYPKCGSEMKRRAAVYTLSVPERWVCECGHEKKVGGEK